MDDDDDDDDDDDINDDEDYLGNYNPYKSWHDGNILK
jgi:hypothetical protein